MVNRVDPLPALIRTVLRRADRRSAQCASAIAVNSRFTAQNISPVYRRKATVCYPAVDGDAFRPAANSRERLVLSVGALTPTKGFDFLIRAIAAIPERSRPSLVIASNYQEAAELAYLKSLAGRLAVDARFLCNISDADLQDLYARAGCVAYAPHREPLGLAALEAMSAGAPVVGVAEGGVVETIIDGETGLLRPREEGGFAQAIAFLLSRVDAARRMGDAARTHVLQNWNWPRHMARLQVLLTEAAG